MTKAGERKIETVEKANGGAGFIMKEALLSTEELGNHCKMFSKVCLLYTSIWGTSICQEEAFYV